MTTEELRAFQTNQLDSFIAAYLADIKQRAGYMPEVTAFDAEVEGLMSSGVMDMLTGGVPASMFMENPIDKRILNTLSLYVNAYIEHDRTDTRKYLDLYHRNVQKLSLEDGGGWDVEPDD